MEEIRVESEDNIQLNEIWQEIERLEPLTSTGWLDALLSQLDTNAFADAPPDEIENWMETQSQYINQIQADILSLENKIGQIQQIYTLAEESNSIAQDLEILEISYPTEKDDALETTLLYLLAGLEIWGAWLEPNNNAGLLPEAEGRFMVSSTPILQTGVVPGGIGVVGFAQPITISRNGIPEGFSANNLLYEAPLAGYDDYVEDVFERVSYLDRLNYQYGVEVTGRVARVYSKNIEIELTLASMLGKMGAPPEVAEIWVAEYAEVAHLPQSIQLSWLIAGNPLAEDYQVYVGNALAIFDLNVLLEQDFSGNFSLSQNPSTRWVSQDPFWTEVQKQPFLSAFADLLSSSSEEIRRSFIVSLFFLESTPLGTKASKSSDSDVNISLRSKPFFWSDTDTTPTSTIPNTNGPVSPAAATIVDPDQGLVAEAMQQKKNLIKYWIPGQGYQIIPWSQRNLLNPNDKGTPYFIMAVTALPQFSPKKESRHKSNYETIVSNVANDHLPRSQPVLKVFTGPAEEDRKITDKLGVPIYFAGSAFLWTAERFDNDTIIKYATSHHKAIASPYAVVSIDNGPYIAGGLSQIKKLFKNRQDYTLQTVVLKAKGIMNYRGKSARNSPPISRELQNTWLNYAGKVAQDIFSSSFSRQDRVFIQSSHRFVEFERSHADPEIKISSMVAWNDLPSNAELLNRRNEWKTDLFLMRARQGYFLLRTNEIEYLQKHADEESQVHTLLITSSAQKYAPSSIQTILQNKNLDCESVRVLSETNIELAYSPQCSLVVTESGWELARANDQTLLATTLNSDQPIAIFHPEDKPASALSLSLLVDAKQSSLENLQISTLVPVYDLVDLDAEEKEVTISLGIADAIGRSLQFFPEQKEFEVLMPKGKAILERRVRYTSIPPENPATKYDYDKVNVTVPAENQSITFYSLREGTTSTLSGSSAQELELPQNEIMTSSGEWDKEHIIELAQSFHQTHSSPYLIVQSSKGKFYGGSISKLKSAFFKSKETSERLGVIVTRLTGTNIGSFSYQSHENLGWLSASSLIVLEQSKSLEIDPSSTVTVWSTTGKRKAIFTADGTLQIEQIVQWQTRPDNQTLKSLRQTWQGNMVLVYIPDQGYFLAQPNEVKYLLDLISLQIDSLILSFEMEKNFADIISRTKAVLEGLPTRGSVRVLSSFASPNLKEIPFYNGTDLAFYFEHQKGLQLDLERSGLELARQSPEQWLSYAEAKNSPIAIFQRSDGNKSLALFRHIIKGTQQAIVGTEPQLIVPAYTFEDLDESILDQSEIEESIFITLKEALRQASAIWPNQSSFQIVMPMRKTLDFIVKMSLLKYNLIL